MGEIQCTIAVTIFVHRERQMSFLDVSQKFVQMPPELVNSSIEIVLNEQVDSAQWYVISTIVVLYVPRSELVCFSLPA